MNALETLNQSVFFALNAQPGAAEGLLSLAPFLRQRHRVYDAGDRARPVVSRWS